MTAQIGDVYKYRGKHFTLVASSAEMPFSPEAYGLEPHFCCTACWDGYWCEYKIDGKLYLQNLFINCKNDNYPPVNGIQVSPVEYAKMGHHVYQDLDLEIPFSGNILIGAEFLQEYYIHMGLQRPFAYSTLLELVFLNGVLIDAYNRSDIAKKLRKRYNARWAKADEGRENPDQEALPDLWWL